MPESWIYAMTFKSPYAKEQVEWLMRYHVPIDIYSNELDSDGTETHLYSRYLIKYGSVQLFQFWHQLYYS